MRILVKLGGSLLDSAASRNRLAREITALSGREHVVVVHGGGKQMTRYLEAHGIESRFVNGLRVTTDEVLDAVLKIFAGTVNSELAAAFRAAGARPVGLSGIDAGLIEATALDPELGHVGSPISSDARILELLTQAGYLPVLACVAGDSRGGIYNVNGDQMAAACAAAFGALKLVFLTDVEGVRDAEGKILPRVTVREACALIREGIASGGMQAKLEAAMSALERGVSEVHIAAGSQIGIVEKVMAEEDIGTRIVK